MQKEMISIREGNPCHFGARENNGCYYFTIAVPDGKKADLLLYQHGQKEPWMTIPLPEKERAGIVSSISLTMKKKTTFEYCYRIDGKTVPDEHATWVVPFENELRCKIRNARTPKSSHIFYPFEDTILYKLHVKGFTADASSKVRKKGTFKGLSEKIPYLREMGITSVLMMPVYEFEEVEDNQKAFPFKEEKPENFWGYTPGLYYAPKASYASSDNAPEEFSNMIDAFHEAGIEVLLEFYFDQQIGPDRVLSILHYWYFRYKVDGFRLIAAQNVTDYLSKDPLLRKAKLLFESCDESTLNALKNPVCRNISLYNKGFEYCMRKFLKGDEGSHEGAMWALLRNSANVSYINFFADQDGFTMNDMVSYGARHNEANGQDGIDGTIENYSWNCGFEGESKKKAVKNLRMRQLKNAFTLLFLSEGTPMILAGDEFLNSQKGNNNAWCQDNPIGWVNWNHTKGAEELRAYVKNLIAFRKNHSVFRTDHPLRQLDYKGFGFPELSFHSDRAWCASGGYLCHEFAMLLNGQYAKKEDVNIYVICNLSWLSKEFAIPDSKEDTVWSVKIDTAGSEGFLLDGSENEIQRSDDKLITLPPRSIQVLIGKRGEACRFGSILKP